MACVVAAQVTDKHFDTPAWQAVIPRNSGKGENELKWLTRHVIAQHATAAKRQMRYNQMPRKMLQKLQMQHHAQNSQAQRAKTDIEHICGPAAPAAAARGAWRPRRGGGPPHRPIMLSRPATDSAPPAKRPRTSDPGPSTEPPTPASSGFAWGCDGVADRATFDATARMPVTMCSYDASAAAVDALFASRDVEVVTSGYIWTEGPLWVAAERALYFTCVPSACIYRWTERDGVSLHVRDAGGYDGTNVADIGSLAEPGSNGMASDPQDPSTVFVCQHPTHRVVRARLRDFAAGSRWCDDSNAAHWSVVTDAIGGRPFNSPNDVAISPTDGAVWFTDPPYGLLEKARCCDEWVAPGAS